jgi:plastocyanin
METENKIPRWPVLVALFVALVLLAFIASLFAPPKTPQPEAENKFGELIRRGEMPMPAYSISTAEKLAMNPEFHALVSYTDVGFEPQRVEIKEGETVRFTNNSSEELWIASDPSTPYPQQEGDLCNGENLDTCGPIPSMDFWEFTFDRKGEWYVVNNLEKTQKVFVVVE